MSIPVTPRQLWTRFRDRRHRLAIVLSGGGAMGAFQVGLIEVLARRQVHPDLIVGTSVGAINGAYWALHPGPDVGRRLFAIWSRIRRTSFLSGGRLQMIRNLMGNRDHLYPTHLLAHLLSLYMPPGVQIDQLSVPLAITVCDAVTGERALLRRGSLHQALIASAAIPGIFPPAPADGRLRLDGGVVANCDLEAVAESGLRQAIAVDLSGLRPATPPLNAMDAAGRAVMFTVRRQTDLTLGALAERLSVILVRPQVSGLVQFGDFTQTKTLFKLGQQFGERLCDQHLDPVGNVRPGRLERLEPEPESVSDPAPGLNERPEIA
jgi:NTE family protein